MPLASTVCNQSNLMIRGMTGEQVQHVSRSFGFICLKSHARVHKKLTAGTFDWNFSRHVLRRGL